MNQLLITVIIPVYNVEEYLDKCVQSVIDQTYRNLEIILVDDGSPDNCPQMCDRYAQKDDRIKVIHKENGGLSDARNIGIDNANGEYLMFIDSDDYIDKTMCEKLYNALKKHKTDIAICDLSCVDVTGNKIPEMNGNSPICGEIITDDEIYEGLNNYNYWYYVVAWNKLYHKSIFKDIRYPFGKLHEDEFTFHHILKKSRNWAVVSEVLYFYVQRNNSIVNSKISIGKLDGAEAFFERVDFALKEGRKEIILTSLRTGINRMLFCYQISKESEVNKKRFAEVHALYKKQYKNVLKTKIKIKFKSHIFFYLAYHSIGTLFFIKKLKGFLKNS